MPSVIIEPGSLILLSGLPASGKSSLKKNAQGFRDLDCAWLSSDDLRVKILGCRKDVDTDTGETFTSIPQNANATVFAILRQVVAARLEQGLTCILDSCACTDADRKAWADLAAEKGRPFKVLILDTPLEECLRADKLRDTRVSERVIREMHSPTPTTPVKNSKGVLMPVTPPQGFMLSSVFPHSVISRDHVLRQVLPDLGSEDWDVVGDVHGMKNELLDLLAKAGWQHLEGRLHHPLGRKLLFLGDLVDRGPDSLGVLRLVKKAVDDGVARCIKGNHEIKLVRFVEDFDSKGVSSWSSYSNAETGLLLAKAEDKSSLMAFMRFLPSFQVLQTLDGKKLGFVHANVTHFDAELTLAEHMHFGPRGRGIDTDAKYALRSTALADSWTVFRGHCPQTSPQENIFSLERQSFQCGQLVLLPLDAFLTKVREGASQLEAFDSSVITENCIYDFNEMSKGKTTLCRQMNALAASKHVSKRVDPTNCLTTYKYTKETFWKNKWHESEWLLKARGLVLDAAGQIVSHPFDKCFNYGELKTGEELPDDTPLIAVEKLNGFLGICSAHPFKPGKLLLHTQGSFESEFIDYMRDSLSPKQSGLMAKFLAENNVTLMGEVIHADDPHIIDYKADEQGFWLIGIRGKNPCDQPWTEADVDKAAQQMGLRRPSWVRATKAKLLERCKQETVGILRLEGWMARADTPEQAFLFKLKTPYYLTTKFLGRLSAAKVAHMFNNPETFKRSMDEEFYALVDLITKGYRKDEFLKMDEEDRKAVVRKLICEQLDAGHSNL